MSEGFMSGLNLSLSQNLAAKRLHSLAGGGGGPTLAPGEFYDDFNRSDRVLTSDGAGWSFISGTESLVHIQNNALTVSDLDGVGTLVVAPDVGSTDMFVEFNIGVVNVPTGAFVAVSVLDSTHYMGIRAGYMTNNGALEVFTRYDNAFSSLISDANAGVVPGDLIRLNVDGLGNWEALVNGVHKAGGQTGSGVIGHTFAGIVARNHEYAPFIDNFHCGRL